MTGYSALCGEMFARRSSSRRAALSASSGQARARRASARSSLISASCSLVSPSSCWMALSCWRRKYSRWLLSISLRTSLWILEPSSSTSSSWVRMPMRRRRRCSTSLSSSSACLSSVLMRMVLAMRKASGPGLLDVGRRHLELFGQVGHERDDLARTPAAGWRAGRRPRVPSATTSSMLRDVGGEVRLFLRVAVDVHALQALHEDAHGAVRQLDHLVGEPHGARPRSSSSGPGRLDLGVLAGDERQQAVAGEHVVDELDGALLPDGERDHRVGEDDRVAQRQHRQRAGDLLLAAASTWISSRLAHASPPRSS